MHDYKIISQHVDTLLLHFYHGESTTVKDLLEYGKKISALSDLKDEAYGIKNQNNDLRFVNHMIGGHKFRVMATTVKGFQVSLQNQDVSISFKSISQKTEKDYPEKFDFNSIVETKKQPVIRVEFRASFLARVGHENAIKYVFKLIIREFLTSVQIKVSRIDLATDVQGYNFHQLDRYRFRTRKKTTVGRDEERDKNGYYYFGKKFLGFSFGGGDDMIRVYNKTMEIKQNPDKEFIKTLVWSNNPNYNPDREVWRIEVQYRREKLKTMYDEENGLLDGFENVLRAIPSLWRRALESFTLVDLPKKIALEHFLGHTEDENGFPVPLEQNTVSMRIKRAAVHPLWELMMSWNFSIGTKVKILTAPVTGAFTWVSNSIKSLYSTALKHFGDISPKILEDAFLRAEAEIFADKGLTLLDNAFNNTLDYLGNCVKYALHTGDTGIVERDTHSTLKANSAMYVREITKNLFDVYGTHDDYLLSRARILNKTLGRLVV